MQRKLFEITFENQTEAKSFLDSGLVIESHVGNHVRVAVQGNYDKFVEETARYKIRNIDIFTQNLEEIFMNYYDQKETMK
jgi:ABC-2 type transport system ATP-binding protein